MPTQDQQKNQPIPVMRDLPSNGEPEVPARGTPESRSLYLGTLDRAASEYRVAGETFERAGRALVDARDRGAAVEVREALRQAFWEAEIAQFRAKHALLNTAAVGW